MKWRDIAAHLSACDDEFLDTECKIIIDDDGVRKEATTSEILDGGLKATTVQYRWIIHWKDGQNESVTGPTFASAFSMAGYSAGAMAAVDEYELADD